MVLRNESLQEANQEIRCESESVDLIPIGHRVLGM